MTNGEIVVSGDELNPILISMVYIVALGFARLRLLSRLSPSVAPIAVGLMLSQIAVIGISTYYAPSSSYEAWLWHLDREFNIPSTLAFAQLAICGGAALLAAWLARAAPAWQRLYLVGIGAIFLYWAIDEYFKIHEFNRYWHIHYAALGAIVALGTALAAWRSPRQSRIWYRRLLTGLAQPASVDFESGIRLRGYRIETSKDDIRVHLYASAKPPDLLGLGSSINLVDQADGESVAHLDKRADYRHGISLLGARLPTRLWYSGLADSEVWTVPLPADLAPGRYDAFTGLYRARDNERVSTTGADGAPWLDNRAAPGRLMIGG